MNGRSFGLRLLEPTYALELYNYIVTAILLALWGIACLGT